MTVHAQRVDVRHPHVTLPSPLLLVWIPLAIAAALVLVAVLVLLDIIGPAEWSGLPQVQDLVQLRETIGAGGFI